ncbi:MAG: hypothetical protein KJ674_01765 [Nanoarchaeota archaeon]|nr:hypothetical protein [Nanoarchaeota archaeon]
MINVDDIKKKNGSKNEYKITYDSISEGLEPIYFWLLDFMSDTAPNGLGLNDVVKNREEFEAAVSSGYFGEMGTRASVMQDRAMKMMATINTVIRSMINLIYDLREFELRLKSYENIQSFDKDKKEAGKLALKQVWMDNVDIKRGRGSINMLAQQLEFVTLRDAFMIAKNENDVETIDLNDRVKRILKARISEYLEWEKHSETELRKRFNIEKSYLKSQVNSLKLYTKWVKPYLISAKKLGMSDFESPNIVNAFNNMEIKMGLFGKKEIMPGDLHESYQGVQLDTKYYACVEVEIKFRTVPRAVQGQAGSQYIHAGRTDLIFRSYGLTNEEIEQIKKSNDQEDMELIEGMTDTSLKEMAEDLDHFLKEEEKEEKKVKNFESPFGNIFKGFGEMFGFMKHAFGFMKQSPESSIQKKLRDLAKEKAEGLCYTFYDVYKKAHGMVTW